MSQEAPVLKVWLYAAIVFLTSLSLFVGYAYSSHGPYEEILQKSHRAMEDSLKKITQTDTAAISIVVLGSSLTEHAILDSREIEASILEKANKKSHVFRIALNYFNMEVAERIDFFEYIVRYPPTYLFIENFSMNVEDEVKGLSFPGLPIEMELLDLRNRFRQVIGAVSHENYFVKWYTYDAKPLEVVGFLEGFDSTTFKLLLERRCVVRKISQNEVANRAFDKLSKAGTKVILLDMPQSDKLQTNFLDERGTKELEHLLSSYKKTYHVDYWKFPVLLPDSCFADGIHLSHAGSMRYKEWFASKFTSLE